MSLLNVTVKKANFQGVQAQQFNTYVTLKLQNVKSTTVTVKGANPCWEQDFLFETNDINTGLLVEVWSKGMLWDRALGYHYIPLPGVSYANEDDCGKWVSLDSDVEMRGGEVVGTANPTGHHLLIACRFEQPFDPENTEAADLQRKLEMLNSSMDQEVRAEQARRQTLYNIGHSGYSEDSDYTSDLNYPVGGQGANSSASQFRTAANQLATPQRSLETSRENSYERDDHQIPATVGGRLAAGTYGSYNYSSRGHSPRYDEPYPGEGPPQRYTAQQGGESSEPLSYNSRPRGYKEYRRRKHTWDYEDSQDGWYSEGYDYQGTRIDDAKIYSDTEYYPSTTNSKRRGPHRRPSLERQTTLYDEQMHYGSDMYTNDPRIGKMSAIYPECQTDVIRNDYYDSTMGYVYQDERYGQDDEDRQWDSGGKWYMGPSTYQENKRNRKSLPQRPASSIGINRPNYRPTVTRQRSYESEELDYSGTSSRRRKPLQPQKRPSSRQDGSTGKKLPPTPSQPSNVILGRKPVSLPATPGRQLPRTRTPSEDGYYKSDYNEDYNYAYRSSQDNLPQDNYQITSSHPDDVVSHQQTYTTDVYSTSVHIQDNQYVGDYSSKAVVDQYSQDYVVPDVTQDAYDATGQSVYNNSYVSDYQEYVNPPTSQSIYHDTYQGNTYPKVSEIQQQSQHQQLAQYPENTVLENNYQSVPYDKNNTDTYHDVYQDSYEDSFKQDSFPDSYKQDSYADSYKQDSFPDSYKQDSFPESYTDSYKDDNYQDTDNNQTQYGDFNMPVCSSNYEPTVTTSVYDQQYQYDNKYNVSTSTYDQQQQQQPQQQPQQQQPQQQQPYNHDQSVPTTLDNYKEQQQQQQQNYSMEYEIPYKENQVSDYKNDYEEYEDSYQDSYQGSFDEPYKNRDEKRLSEVPELSVTTPKGQTKTNGYQSSESEYFYQSQDLAGSTRRKKLGKQGLPQAEDSLELRDDELKDSFETAVSSVSSNVPRTAYSEYSTAGESSPVATTLVDSPASSSQAAVVNHVTDHVPVCTTTAIVHSTAMVNGKRPLARTESYVEEAGDDEYPEIMKELHRKDSQMSNQSHVSQHSNHSQKPKLSRGESYTSAEHYDETYGNRRESFRKARQDSYGSVIEEDFKPPLNRTDSYQKHELTRGVSVYGQNYATPQPISRAESYQRGYFKEQDSLDETEIVLSSAINGEYKMRDETLERYERGEEALARGSRENSLVEPYKGSPTLSRSGSPRGSITKQTSLEESVQMDTPPRSPPEPPADEELLDMVGAAPVPTQLKERPEMTAKQRWHWAYNKIIMQLNVSKKKSKLYLDTSCELVAVTIDGRG